MSKVLVDRELLERVTNMLDAHNYARDAEALMEAIAQPAEAEGVELPGMWQESDLSGGKADCEDGMRELRRYTPISQGDHIPAMNSCDQGGWVRYADHLAALSAVTAERDRLREALNFACKALCQVTSSDGSGHADIALSVLRLAGVGADEREALVEGWKANVKWRADAAMAAK